MNSIDVFSFSFLFFFPLSFDKRNGWRWSCAGFSYALSWALVSSVCWFYIFFSLLTVTSALHDEGIYGLFIFFLSFFLSIERVYSLSLSPVTFLCLRHGEYSCYAAIQLAFGIYLVSLPTPEYPPLSLRTSHT